MPKRRVLLFDMDGLLLDTESLHTRAYSKLTHQLGVPQPEEAIIRFIGHAAPVTCKWMIEELGCKITPEEIIRRELDLYYELLENERPAPLPGVREFFDFSQRENMPRALVSSSIAEQVEPTMQIVMSHLNRVGHWRSHFHSVATGERVQQRKPAPDLYQLAMKELEALPNECVAFEDSPAGVTAARAAGCKVVAIPNMYLNRKEVVDAGADLEFATLLDAFKAINAVLA